MQLNNKQSNTEQLNLNSRITLNNGYSMPLFGLGTWHTSSTKPIQKAAEFGYQLFDTSKNYHNEMIVGEALRNSEVKRENLFVTTKLEAADFKNVQKAFDESNKKLGLGYIDLYLIHWPERDWISAWNQMEKLPKEKCGSIGVSNFTERDLVELLRHSNTVPAVNQIKFSPFEWDQNLLDYCEEREIAVEGYSPLSEIEEPIIKEIAEKYGKSPAQLIIRWVLQHNVIAIPKTSSEERIIENANVFDFEIKEEDMETIDGMKRE